MMPRKRAWLLQRAAQLRANPTNAESLLWARINAKQMGVRFRRQHVQGDFILDFYCVVLQLAIELDGPVHQSSQDYDEWRAEQLQNQGILVLRFTNESVIFSMDDVLQTIQTHL